MLELVLGHRIERLFVNELGLAEQGECFRQLALWQLGHGFQKRLCELLADDGSGLEEGGGQSMVAGESAVPGSTLPWFGLALLMAASLGATPAARYRTS